MKTDWGFLSRHPPLLQLICNCNRATISAYKIEGVRTSRWEMYALHHLELRVRTFRAPMYALAIGRQLQIDCDYDSRRTWNRELRKRRFMFRAAPLSQGGRPGKAGRCVARANHFATPRGIRVLRLLVVQTKHNSSHLQLSHPKIASIGVTVAKATLTYTAEDFFAKRMKRILETSSGLVG